jgi:hypothetical protein
VAVVNNGNAFAVPPEVVTSDEVEGDADEELTAAAGLLELASPAITGVASTNAEAGKPPRVWASAAFKA